MMNHSAQITRPMVGVSACLLGDEVRFDGGHKRNAFIAEVLGNCFQFVSSCPEAAIGLGIPRPPIRLMGTAERPRAVGVKDASQDVTEALEGYSHQRVAGLMGLSGYILKKDSPSCGMQRVKLYPGEGRQPLRTGQGIFARILMQQQPLLPVEEEGRLNDWVLRENFVNRVYIYHRWQRLLAEGLTAAALLDFHARCKYLLMAHSRAAYKRLGRLLSDLKNLALDVIAKDYIQGLMTALKRPVTRKRHVNVLQHIMGYLKGQIDGGDKQELLAAIETYRRAETPLVVPLTLLKHYFRRHPDPYIERQLYLQPHPEHLGLRNQL
jgi:uncharacterized protein YbgA (DUF1722 family)/uncharacterized protein YbbK (DUF523 family)